MFRFFTQKVNAGGFVIDDPVDLKHMLTVLRLKQGDRIEIVNNSRAYEAVIDIVSGSFVRGTIIKNLNLAVDKIRFRLFLGTIRPRLFELVIEKVTELGVFEIVPVVMKNSQFSLEIYSAKINRFKKIALVAGKQSKQLTIPNIAYPLVLPNVLSQISPKDLNAVFDLTPKAISPTSLIPMLSEQRDINCFVGPEGGFSKEDDETLNNLKNLVTVKLSNHILRAETAAIVGFGILKVLTIDN